METTNQICVMALEAGIPAFVRVPANTNPSTSSRVLDGGALGVIAPGVRSAEEARAVVAAAKYPPLGERGCRRAARSCSSALFRGGDSARAQRRDAGDRAVRVEGGARRDGGDRRGRRRRPGLIGTND